MKNKLSLYEISNEYAYSFEKLLELDIDEETFNDTLEGMQGDFRDQAINIAYIVKNIETTADAIKEAYDNMYNRRKILQDKADRLRQYLVGCMDNAEIYDINDCPDFSIKLRTNPASLVIYDEKEIPDCFWKVPKPTPILDKLSIKSDLKDGKEIPGAELVYNMSVQIK